MITSVSDISEESLAREMQHIAEYLDLKDAEESLYFPKYFVIETIRICNARCPFCAIDQWDNTVPLMSDKLFDKIVDEISQYSQWIKNVNVQRAGEPLLDRKIVGRVRKVKQAGIKRVCMSTNASLLTDKKAIELFDAGLDDIMISIDSIEKETYEKFRAGLNFERVMSNIKTLFKVRDEVKPDAIIRIRGVSFFDLDKEEDRNKLIHWEDFWRQFTKPQDRAYMKKSINWGNQKYWEDKLPNYDWVYHPCIIPWSTMNITAMGTVALCGEDFDGKMNIGDINEQSIAEVWKNDIWTRIREMHRSGNRNEIHFCQGCITFDDMSLENWRQNYKIELNEKEENI